ncbi:MAG: helix-turn-helix domain-containing protein [Proteobacteria bacterium]|nr:helix-turn-helix domain-containing protein [Pseudomonadota bacterium]
MRVSEWNDSNLPRRLKRARQTAGLTQAQLASLLGTQQPTVSRIEFGRKPRGLLLSRVLSFIEDTERPAGEIQEDIVSAIAHSDELKALIARIAAEL